MTMFHLVASILAISDSITDLVLLDAPSVLADELVKPAVDIAALFVLALRTIVAFVASSFRRDALPVVALETLGPAGQPPVRNAIRQAREGTNNLLYSVKRHKMYQQRHKTTDTQKTT